MTERKEDEQMKMSRGSARVRPKEGKPSVPMTSAKSQAAMAISAVIQRKTAKRGE